MKTWKIIAFVPAIVCLGIVIFYPNILKFKSSKIDTVLPIIGLVVFITISYFIFKSKKIFLYIILGFIFTLISYGIVFHHWLQSYPIISITLITIFLLIIIIFLGFATYKMIKDLFNKLH